VARRGRALVGSRRPLEPHRAEVAVAVRDRHERVHACGEPDPFFEGLDDLLVILAIGGRLIDVLAVEKSHAAPAIDQRLKVGLLAACRGSLPFLANLAAVPEELVENLQFFLVETVAQSRFIGTRADLLVAIQ
jgi:hypothetical protein